ncbi:hypothetical protein EB796_009499 [Bugula neritina]|uniref:Uncharacterized protein n=1 Tax=Bugula neritina TaxID=10212 RepID=A0A7J7K3Q7_BUGNE|nr:hypothetical protein EB796_009499 [Bugula neritina]
MMQCMVQSLPVVDLQKLLTIQDKDGQTAMHRASSQGHTETLKLMTDVLLPTDLLHIFNEKDAFTGDTVAHEAAFKGHTKSHAALNKFNTSKKCD